MQMKGNIFVLQVKRFSLSQTPDNASNRGQNNLLIIFLTLHEINALVCDITGLLPHQPIL